MSDPIEQAIADLRGRDAAAYREARAAYHSASAAYDEAALAIGAAGKSSYQKLERYLAKALAPHRVEWQRYHAPSTQPGGGGDVNHADWTTTAHLAGEVWPQPKGGRYNMPMRADIPFSMSPRDGAEFRRMVAALKAAADAMTEGGL